MLAIAPPFQIADLARGRPHIGMSGRMWTPTDVTSPTVTGAAQGAASAWVMTVPQPDP